jgi:quercetin dioxygenase-like cupin family protein
MAQQEIIRKELLQAKTGQRSISKVEVWEIIFQPGQIGAYHKHPCPVLGYIIYGSILFQVEGELPTILNEGDAFYEPAETPIVHFENFSENENAKFVSFYLLNGDQPLIEMLPTE